MDKSDRLITAVKSQPENASIQFVQECGSNLSLKQLPVESLSEVVQAKDPKNDKRAVLVKYALPHVKYLGASFKLVPERLTQEFVTLSKFHSISPKHVCHPYLCHKETQTMIMEDPGNATTLQDQINTGHLDMNVVQQLAKFLAQLHQSTHSAKMSPQETQQLQQQFQNEDMTSLAVDDLFKRPYDKNISPKVSDEVKAELSSIGEEHENWVATLDKFKTLYLEKKEALIHGNLHLGAIFVIEGYPKVFDAEFSHMGPCAYDLGVILAHHIICYHQHMLTPVDNDQHRQISYQMLKAANVIGKTYFDNMTCSVGPREDYISGMMTEVAGFTALELIRRVAGPVHLECLDQVPGAAMEILQSAIRLLTAHERIHNVDFLLNIALMLTF